MRIAQLADFHFTRLTWNPFRLFSKRLLAHLNWILFRRKNFFETQLDQLPSLLKELQVDLVLLGGDFTTTALHTEFERAAKFVKQLEAPWIAIPGNHDCYTWRSYRKKHFYRYFTNQRKQIAHPVEFFNLKDHGVEAHRSAFGIYRNSLKNREFGKEAPQNFDSEQATIAEGQGASEDRNFEAKPTQSKADSSSCFGIWIVAMDTAQATNPYSSEGLFSDKIERNLKEVLALISPNDSILLLNHYPFFQNDEPRRNLKRGDQLQQILKDDPRIRLYLHGHTHRHTVANLQVSQLPVVLDSGSCAHGKKGSWNLIDLTADGCKVSTYRWDGQWTQIRTEGFEWTRN